MSFFAELKRRNVVRVGLAYVITGWLVLQGADFLFDLVGAPNWVIQTLSVLVAIGLPIALVFSWAFEMTPEGIKKESEIDRTQSITRQTGRKLDRIIIAVLALALGYFIWDKVAAPLVPPPEESVAEQAGPASAAEPEQSEEPSVDIPEKSIAVLPFVNMSNDPEQEFFSDGISEELLNVLAKMPGVQVAARTSSFQFKGHNQDIGEIARMLKVRHVLEGSVRKAGNKLRITAQLIEANSGYHLWSETYDRELDDVFAIQDEISAAIGEAMRVELALGRADEKTPLRVAESSNTAAYEAFLRGRYLVNQRGTRNLEEAEDHLERAVRLDPEYAPAYAWLAIATTLLISGNSSYGDYSLAEVTDKALPLIERALELDPNLAEAYGATALLSLSTPDLQRAVRDADRALELNPVFVDALNWRNLAASALGDHESQIEGLKEMIRIDPLTIVGRLNYASNLSHQDLDYARELAMSIIEQNAWAGYTARGIVEAISLGDLSEGVRWLLRAYGEVPTDAWSNYGLMYAIALTGEFEEARRISERSLWSVEIEAGNFETAAHQLTARLQDDPGNVSLQHDVANALFYAGRLEEARQYYESWMSTIPEGVVAISPLTNGTDSLLRYAWILKQNGESEGWNEALERHRADFAERKRLDILNSYDYFSEAMAYALLEDEQGVFSAYRTAIEMGFRERSSFGQGMFEGLAQHPEFLAIKAELEQIVDRERDELLQIMCHENPVPDTWQPMKQTCLGVVAQI